MDQISEAGHEVAVHDQAGKSHTALPFQDLGDGIQVDHYLDDVGRVVLAGLDVDDDGFLIVRYNEVWLAGQGGGRSL